MEQNKPETLEHQIREQQISETAHEPSNFVKTVWRVFWILLGVTCFEIGIAFLHYATFFPPRAVLNAIFLTLTLVKAFFIVAEFMHLKHEIKNLILVILIPLCLFIWFITAFLADGASWKNRKEEVNRVEVTQPGMHAPQPH